MAVVFGKVPKQERSMKIVIRLTTKQEAKALPIILRHSPGMVLPGRTYIVSEETVIKLKAEGIRFKEIGRESDKPTWEGALSSERV
jgi:hypothetical protein